MACSANHLTDCKQSYGLESGFRKKLEVAQFLGMTENKTFCLKLVEGQRKRST